MRPLLILAHFFYGMVAIPQESLRAELERIHELDQHDRADIGAYAIGSAERDSVNRHMLWQDSVNVVRVTAIIDSLGWLGADEVGSKANRTLWLVLQHAPLATQEEFLPDLQLAVEEGKAAATDLAYLEDRIAMRHGRPQRYGSQIKMVNGRSTLWQLEDEFLVNERRASVGLGPLEDYVAQFGIDWSQPERIERVVHPPSR